jgi:periplasmic protein TonB
VQAPPRAAAPRPAPAAPNAFPAPNNFSLGGPPAQTPHRYAAPHVPGGRQPLNFSLGPMNPGAGQVRPFANFHGGEVGADWRNALRRWLDEHAYYPRQAAEAGEDGDVVVRVVATPDGRVVSATIISRSGSQFLDMAARSMFDDAVLPPFPPSIANPTFTFDLTMHYILIR